jgi:hypothetical protein
MQTPEETLIVDYLKPLGKQFASAKEICRRAGGKQKYAEDPYWAKRLLKTMEKRGVLESNASGHFRIKSDEDPKKSVPISPHIARILAQSGRNFSEAIVLEVDEDYEKLAKKKPEKNPFKKN